MWQICRLEKNQNGFVMIWMRCANTISKADEALLFSKYVVGNDIPRIVNPHKEQD